MRRKHNPKTHFSLNLNIFKLLSIILFLLILFSIPLVIKKSIKINVIECRSQYGECPNEILQGLKNYQNYDYKTVKRYVSSYLDNNLSVQSYLIQYKIPSSLRVDINLKNAKYAVFSKSIQKNYLISSDNIVLTISDTTELPRVITDNLDIKVGDKLPSEYQNAVELTSNLNYLFSIKEGEIQKSVLKVVTSDNINILLPLDVDTKLTIGGLRLIFSRLNDGSEGIRMNDIREIDLRFKNPILRRK